MNSQWIMNILDIFITPFSLFRPYSDPPTWVPSRNDMFGRMECVHTTHCREVLMHHVVQQLRLPVLMAVQVNLKMIFIFHWMWRTDKIFFDKDNIHHSHIFFCWCERCHTSKYNFTTVLYLGSTIGILLIEFSLIYLSILYIISAVSLCSAWSLKQIY